MKVETKLWSMYNHENSVDINHSATDRTCYIFPCSDNSLICVDRLGYHIKEELNKTTSRNMALLRPLKVWAFAVQFLLQITSYRRQRVGRPQGAGLEARLEFPRF